MLYPIELWVRPKKAPQTIRPLTVMQGEKASRKTPNSNIQHPEKIQAPKRRVCVGHPTESWVLMISLSVILEVLRDFFSVAKGSEDVQTGDFFDVVFGVATAHQFGKESGIAGDVVQAFYSAVEAFEIRAESDVIDAGGFA